MPLVFLEIAEGGRYRNAGEQHAGDEPGYEKYNGANARQDESSFGEEQGGKRNVQQSFDGVPAREDQQDGQSERKNHMYQRFRHRHTVDVGPGCAVRFSQGDFFATVHDRRDRNQDIIHHGREQQRESEDRQHDGHVPDIGFAGMHFPYRFQEKCQSVDAGILQGLGDDVFLLHPVDGRTQGFGRDAGGQKHIG